MSEEDEPYIISVGSIVQLTVEDEPEKKPRKKRPIGFGCPTKKSLRGKKADDDDHS